MKSKRSSILVALIVAFGLLVSESSIQASEILDSIKREQQRAVLTLGGIALCVVATPLCVGGALVISAGVLVYAIGKGIAMTVNEQRAATQQLESSYNKEYEKNSAFYGNKANLVKSEFPERIEDRIDAIINQQYINQENQESFEIFSTPKSKIFVLQNIQDFFEFQQGKEFENFNLTVYEICTKKINELERMNVSENDNLIDAARDNYRNQLGISASTLKNMSSAQVNQKIYEVQESVNQLARDLVDKRKEINRNTDADFRALVSILTHLYYKQSEKQKMFIGEGLKEGWQRPAGRQIVVKRPNVEGLTLVERAALMRSLGRNPEAEQYTQEAFEQKQQEYQEAARQPAQQSLWSRVKSWFGWR